MANHLDAYVAAGDYSYQGLNLSVRPSTIIREFGEHSGSAAQYSGDYLEVRLPEGDALLEFKGEPSNTDSAHYRAQRQSLLVGQPRRLHQLVAHHRRRPFAGGHGDA